jgi:hypothetical protein
MRHGFRPRLTGEKKIHWLNMPARRCGKRLFAGLDLASKGDTAAVVILPPIAPDAWARFRAMYDAQVHRAICEAFITAPGIVRFTNVAQARHEFIERELELHLKAAENRGPSPLASARDGLQAATAIEKAADSHFRP